MSGVVLFICGREKTPCFSCSATARTSCSEEGCGRPLCDTHARRVDGKDRCAKHAPMTTNPNMPRPPRRTEER